MNLKIKLTYFLLLVLFNCGLAQDYNWPIDSPRVITGNYGEIRPNHFHAGLDFSTNGKVNFPVYAIEEGYVSRVKVSSVGYGRSIYITHPDGKVSVYAHLNSYNGTIGALVKAEQYLKQNYEVEFFPKPNNLKIKRREIIGLSGNSGGSTGPHLHFEIRDAQTETPLNPLEYFNINDTISPTISEVGFYNLADTCVPKYLTSLKTERKKNGELKVNKDSIILKQGILGFAFSGYDQFVSNGNQNNIFVAKVYFDDRLIYSHTLNNIDFADGRYVNEFSEMVEKSKKDNVLFQKCFIPTLFPKNFYDKYHNKGRILLIDTNFHKLKLAVHDENGNERIVQFYFKTRKLNYYSKPTINSDIVVDCNKDFMIAKNKLQIFIPAKSLYYSTSLIFENTIESTGKLIILPTEANLRITSIVGFEVPAKFLRNKTKLVLKSGSSVLSPINKRDSVFYSIKNFGWFLIDQDTLAPVVKPLLTESQFNKLKVKNNCTFRLHDNLSGIYNYKLFLNEKWILGEYDAKSGLVVYQFDEDTPKKGYLSFRLEVVDRVGNETVLNYMVKR